MKRYFSLSLFCPLLFTPLVLLAKSNPFEQALTSPQNATFTGSRLSKSQVKQAQETAWSAYKKAAIHHSWHKDILPVSSAIDPVAATQQRPELDYAEFSSDDKKMPYTLITRGKKPASGWPLFIALHGGGKYHGNAPMEAHGWNVNTREWQAQQALSCRVYQPDGLYLVPRMADDRLGRWWHKHNIDIFTKAIRNAILFNEVDPNRVYILGISQGGYGTSHLAPLLADHFAAAGPMAGGMMTVAENLRNLPFRTDIGEHDTAYRRIELAKELHDKLEELRAEDPEGYKNQLSIQKGRGHGIDYSESPSWLVENTRNPYPEKVVWRCHEKDGIYQDSFYWLSLANTPSEGEVSIVANYDKATNSVNITAEDVLPASEKGGEPSRKALSSSDLIVHLNDQMLDLDKEVTIHLNGKQSFKGKVERKSDTILRNIIKRGDINYAFPAQVVLKAQ